MGIQQWESFVGSVNALVDLRNIEGFLVHLDYESDKHQDSTSCIGCAHQSQGIEIMKSCEKKRRVLSLEQKVSSLARKVPGVGTLNHEQTLSPNVSSTDSPLKKKYRSKPGKDTVTAEQTRSGCNDSTVGKSSPWLSDSVVN